MLFDMIMAGSHVRRAQAKVSSKRYDWTVADVQSAAVAISNRIVRLGGGRGTRVAVRVQDSLESLVSQLGIAFSGGVVVDDPLESSNGLGVDIILASEPMMRLLSNETFRYLKLDMESRASVLELRENHSDGYWGLGYCGQRSVRTQLNFWYEVRGLIAALSLSESDRLYSLMGPETEEGFVLSVACLSVGASVLFGQRHEDSDVSATMSEFNPTLVLAGGHAFTCSVDNGLVGDGELRGILRRRDLHGVHRMPDEYQCADVVMPYYHHRDAGFVAIGGRGSSPGSVGRPMAGLDVYLDSSGRGVGESANWMFGSYAACREMELSAECRTFQEPGVAGRIMVLGSTVSPALGLDGGCMTGNWGYFDDVGCLNVVGGESSIRTA